MLSVPVGSSLANSEITQFGSSPGTPVIQCGSFAVRLPLGGACLVPIAAHQLTAGAFRHGNRTSSSHSPDSSTGATLGAASPDARRVVRQRLFARFRLRGREQDTGYPFVLQHPSRVPSRRIATRGVLPAPTARAPRLCRSPVPPPPLRPILRIAPFGIGSQHAAISQSRKGFSPQIIIFWPARIFSVGWWKNFQRGTRAQSG